MTVTFLLYRHEDGLHLLRQTSYANGTTEVERILEPASIAVRKYDFRFEMAFAGTGPQQLALAILLEAFRERPEIAHPVEAALEYCHAFMLNFLGAASIAITAEFAAIQLVDILAWYSKRASCAQ